jgi:hypothetical protein
MEFIWLTVAAFLTLAVFSFLYQDNPFYKFAEHLFVGVAAGYIVCVEFFQVFLPNLWKPLLAGDHWELLTPFALGLALFTRFFSNYAWISRWPMSVIIGTYAGLAVIGFASGDLVLQIQASMIPVISVPKAQAFAGSPGILSFLEVLANPILTVGLICVLFYFFFSTEHRGSFRPVATTGIVLLMIGFGAGYGYTVMTRIALLFDRLYFLFVDWLHLANI